MDYVVPVTNGLLFLLDINDLSNCLHFAQPIAECMQMTPAVPILLHYNTIINWNIIQFPLV